MKLEDVVKTYLSANGNEVKALNNINYNFEKGKFYAIMGRSGSGKTTLINILGLVDNPTRGKYYFENLDTKKLNSDQMSEIRNKKIGFVFQNFYLNEKLTALENVLLPTLINKEITKNDAANKAQELFAKFNLRSRMNHYPKELSGGEQQRVGLIRALINDPTVILADEPTGNLDYKNEIEILNYLKMLSKDKCIIVVSHNPNIEKYADIVLYLDKGVINESRKHY